MESEFLPLTSPAATEELLNSRAQMGRLLGGLLHHRHRNEHTLEVIWDDTRASLASTTRYHVLDVPITQVGTVPLDSPSDKSRLWVDTYIVRRERISETSRLLPVLHVVMHDVQVGTTSYLTNSEINQEQYDRFVREQSRDPMTLLRPYKYRGGKYICQITS